MFGYLDTERVRSANICGAGEVGPTCDPPSAGIRRICACLAGGRSMARMGVSINSVGPVVGS